jgi:hypothetical protein
VYLSFFVFVFVFFFWWYWGLNLILRQALYHLRTPPVLYLSFQITLLLPSPKIAFPLEFWCSLKLLYLPCLLDVFGLFAFLVLIFLLELPCSLRHSLCIFRSLVWFIFVDFLVLLFPSFLSFVDLA